MYLSRTRERRRPLNTDGISLALTSKHFGTFLIFFFYVNYFSDMSKIESQRSMKMAHSSTKHPDLHPATQLISHGYNPALSAGAVKPPVFLTSTFAFHSAQACADHFDIATGRVAPAQNSGVGALVYSRLNHPNLEIVEDRFALLDGAECALLTSSGMAAVSSVFLTFTRPGDAVVAQIPLYGGTQNLIDKMLPLKGVSTTMLTDALSESGIVKALDAAAINGPVRIFFFETPANPTMKIADIRMIRKVVDQWAEGRSVKTLLVCDNTLLGPAFQRPLALGADLCVYSLTKYVGGHSDVVAGAVTGPAALLGAMREARGTYGFHLDPFSSWLLSRSLETYLVRIEKMAENGLKVANWLSSNTIIPCRVLHPAHFKDERSKNVYADQCGGPGSTFSILLDGGKEQAFSILDALSLFKIAVSLGGTESLICHPLTSTHSSVPKPVCDAAGIADNLLRVSVGLEHPDDLIADFESAFKQSQRHCERDADASVGS